MFKIFALILVLVQTIDVEALSDFRIAKSELQRLEDLKYYLCGLSPKKQRGPTRRKNNLGEWRGIGWFCVPEANCSGVETTYEITQDAKPALACDAVRYNEGRSSCCFTDKLKPPIKFTDPDWDVYTFTGKSSKTRDFARMDEHRKKLFKTFIPGGDPDVEAVLENYEICAAFPIGIEEGRTVWTPYVCMSETQCAGTINTNIQEDLKFPLGGDMCLRSTSYEERLACCHISAAVPVKKEPNSWKFVEFLTTQKYAPGFRSKFMCEQYAKLVCDGDKDRCAQKVLNRANYTVPGEFPHHALVGIRLPRRQTFHCQGSIISKLFILTSYDCRQDDHTLANIVLVGFKFDMGEEPPEYEQISYIKNHISAHKKHWFLLLKLWRPLTLSPFVRPACIDWYFLHDTLSSQTFDFKEGWIIDYGPLDPSGTFTTNVTRFIYDFYSVNEVSPTNKNIECKARLPEQKKKYFKGKFSDSHEYLCLLGKQIYNSDVKKMVHDHSQLNGRHLGRFSKGASFSTFERYCQWKVYGIYSQNEKYPIPPLVIETVPHALPWIEEIVWRQDFDWLFFDLSWPECADWEDPETTPRRKGGDADLATYQFNFHTMDYSFIKPHHNQYFIR
ncbi:uncharacterized protein LOC128988393 [Macrosteles quadrilineatus]|uniref:uncharacterized protein LOC128988393 n=1 Tax=Macrosteles quadrilineatus TaxID=74068 RepID=UPI0023E0F990|nr:uncharacterized protein LOC128988393 [Macrosteles quadrilineatus]